MNLRETMDAANAPSVFPVMIVVLPWLSRIADVRFGREGVRSGWITRRKTMRWSAIRNIHRTRYALAVQSVDRTLRIDAYHLRDVDRAFEEICRRAPLASHTVEPAIVLSLHPTDGTSLKTVWAGVGMVVVSTVVSIVLPVSFEWDITVGLLIGGLFGLSSWRLVRRHPVWKAREHAFDRPIPLVTSALFPVGIVLFLVTVSRPTVLPGSNETLAGIVLGALSTSILLIGLAGRQVDATTIDSRVRPMSETT